MALSDKDTELIEEYLLGKLKKEETKKVEERIQSDSEFAEEVTFMRDLISATQEKGREMLEEILGEEKGQDETPPPPEEHIEKKMKAKAGLRKKIIRHLQKYWIYYAAALLLLLAVIFFAI
ncbi:MAG: hypothetical protein KGY70_18595 [Bacteroidales bacterium]|nr:hypothetical protein [Bacteroidales bacterium]